MFTSYKNINKHSRINKETLTSQKTETYSTNKTWNLQINQYGKSITS